ncbi:hypothetical protein OG21DRAFT_1479665 [Imleria badia]|nr:hypothetical protein OG21DRAFT_1479665 [Imleria badia]
MSTYKLHALGDYVVSIWRYGTTDNYSTQVDFLPKLKNHILGCLFGNNNKEFTQAQRNGLVFIHNRIYRHKVLRINYTTYDLRWEQDSINPRTHANIMVLSHKDDSNDNAYPYWYARVIGVFHVKVRYRGSEMQDQAPKHFDVLWVRWFTRHMHIKSGWAVRRLPCIGFFPQDEPEGFGFINPNDVIQGIHLIPAFCYGCTTTLLPPSIARNKSENNEDWGWYFVNIFVDRDIFMRHRGGGVGHKSTRETTHCLLDDHETLDKQPLVFERDHNLSEATKESGEYVSMDKSSSAEEESDKETDEDGSEMEVEDGHNEELVMVDDELEDEMDEFGYRGLDQVLDSDDSGDSGDEDVNDVEDAF